MQRKWHAEWRAVSIADRNAVQLLADDLRRVRDINDAAAKRQKKLEKERAKKKEKAMQKEADKVAAVAAQAEATVQWDLIVHVAAVDLSGASGPRAAKVTGRFFSLGKSGPGPQ